MNILPDINIPRGYDEEIFLLYSIMLAISLYVLSKKCEIGKTGLDGEPYVLVMIIIITVILWIKQLTNIYNVFNEDGFDESVDVAYLGAWNFKKEICQKESDFLKNIWLCCFSWSTLQEFEITSFICLGHLLNI